MLVGVQAKEGLDRAIVEIAHTLENEPRETDLVQSPSTAIKLKETNRHIY